MDDRFDETTAPWDREDSASRSLLRLIALSTNDGIWDWNLETDGVYYSLRWLELVGYLPGELRGHIDTFVELLHPDDRQSGERTIAEYLSGARPEYRNEFRLRHKDGSWRWIMTRGVALRDPAGRAIRFAGTHTDITDRVRATERLELMVDERTVDLRAARDELARLFESEEARALELAKSLEDLRAAQDRLVRAEKLAALGRLVAGVAHEINTPVGTSLTTASTMENKSKRFAEEVARGDLRRSSLNDFIESSRNALSQITANLNRAAELISLFKQLGADRTQSDQRIFDLGDLTKQTEKSLRPGLRGRNLSLDVQCQPNILMNSHPAPYVQVLTNLFLNATDHAFPDGRLGSIDIKARELDEDNVEIIFSDNGCGMSPEIKRQAFDPFFTTRRDAGRTGLGLHIVHSLVTDSLGGRIVLETSPGEGTRIQIVLPRIASLPLAAG
jgi:PAS domain S-box-containing protein